MLEIETERVDQLYVCKLFVFRRTRRMEFPTVISASYPVVRLIILLVEYFLFSTRVTLSYSNRFPILSHCLLFIIVYNNTFNI